MKFMISVLAALGYAVTVKCSLAFGELPVHPGVGGLYRGPNSETIIKGPDGSVITAETEGGSVRTQSNSEPIVVAELSDVEPITPIRAVPVSSASISVGNVPFALEVPPVTAHSLQVHNVEIIRSDPHIIEKEIVDAPEVESNQSSDLVGPSGRISTKGSSSVVSGPASTTISEPAKVIVPSPILTAPIVPAVPIVGLATTPILSVPAIDTVSSVTVGPIINLPTGFLSSTPLSVSTLAPPLAGNIVSTLSSLANVQISTHAPSTGLEHFPVSTPSSLNYASSSTLGPTFPSFEVINNNQIVVSTLTPPVNPNLSVNAASSYGNLNNIQGGQISTTSRPELTFSTTINPAVANQANVDSKIDLNRNQEQSLQHAIFNNPQLAINPLLIPSSNVIPPEIRLSLPPGTIDLGSTVRTVTLPKSPALVSGESPNVQKINTEENNVVGSSLRPVGNLQGSNQAVPLQVNGRLDQLDNSGGQGQGLLIPSNGQNNYFFQSQEKRLGPVVNFRGTDQSTPLQVDEKLDQLDNFGQGQGFLVPNNVQSNSFYQSQASRPLGTLKGSNQLPPLQVDGKLDQLDNSGQGQGFLLSRNIQSNSFPQSQTSRPPSTLKESDQLIPLQTDGRLGQLDNSQAQGLFVQNDAYSQSQLGQNFPLLRNTNPVANGIPQGGILGSALAQYGVDPNTVNLSNIPLSSVKPLNSPPSGPNQEIDEISLSLWNRYGRDVKVKKNK